MAYRIVYKTCNSAKLYAACCGLTVWSIHKTQAEAEKRIEVKEEDRENFYSHSSWGSKNYNFPYVLEIDPGELRKSEIYPDMCTLEHEECSDGNLRQAFNYVSCEGLIPLRVENYTAKKERYWCKEF